MNGSVYDYRVRTITGAEQALSEYRNRVLLIVNTASQCGFTPQYSGLQSLQDRFAARGFTVLGFPCNDFGRQEPGDATGIAEFCDTKFKITFPLFDKITLRGAGANPLFEFLARHRRGVLGTRAIKWNFTKFLIDRTGRPIARFAPMTPPNRLEPSIAATLENQASR